VISVEREHSRAKAVKKAMGRTRLPGEAAIGSDRSERIYWRPFTLPLIKAKVRAVVRLMQHGHPETIMFDGLYIGLGDRFDDDRRSVRRKLSSSSAPVT